jgi:hypothetical protein
MINEAKSFMEIYKKDPNKIVGRIRGLKKVVTTLIKACTEEIFFLHPN